MKLKPLLLPALISLLVGCGSDNDSANNNQPSPQPKPPTTEPPISSPNPQPGELLEPGANGDIRQFGGATRLKQERTQALKNSLSDKTVKILFCLLAMAPVIPRLPQPETMPKALRVILKV